MPLVEWSKRLFNDRINFEGALTGRDVQRIVGDRDLKVLQCSSPVNMKTWDLLNNEFFPKRPEVELRVYGFYSQVCDLTFASQMSNVRHFSADCLMDAVGLDHIASMDGLESLGIGIYHLDNFDFLNQVTPRLKKIFLGRTKSSKPDCSPLSRFDSLEKIYLEGQRKNIEVLSGLEDLREVTLRSISTPGLDYLRPLQRLWSLDIKLGGIQDLSAIQGMENIKYLELWQIRALEDISVISNLPGLQYFFMQSLRRVAELPSLMENGRLRRISLENMKGLKDIRSLETAPALREFLHTSAQNMQPEDYLPLLRNPSLERAAVWFGSDKKNSRFNALLREYKIEQLQGFKDFEFE
jgi:hypothetical protein